MWEDRNLNLHLAEEKLLNALDKAIANRDYRFDGDSSLNAQMAITFFKKNDSRYKNYLRHSKDSERLWEIAFHEQIPEFTKEAMPYLPRVSPPELVAEIKTSPQEAHKLACFLVEQGVESLGRVFYRCVAINHTLGKALIDLPASCSILLSEVERYDERSLCLLRDLMSDYGKPFRKEIIRRMVAECDAAGKSSGETEVILKKVTGLIEGEETEFAHWCQQVMSDCRDSEKSCSTIHEM